MRPAGAASPWHRPRASAPSEAAPQPATAVTHQPASANAPVAATPLPNALHKLPSQAEPIAPMPEELGVPDYTVRGRGCVIVSDVERALDYADKSLTKLLRGAWASELTEGEDLAVLTYAETREMLERKGVPFHGTRLSVLFESGFDLVLLRTEKPEGAALRARLRAHVLPKLRRGEPVATIAVAPAAAPIDLAPVICRQWHGAASRVAGRLLQRTDHEAREAEMRPAARSAPRGCRRRSSVEPRHRRPGRGLGVVNARYRRPPAHLRQRSDRLRASSPGSTGRDELAGAEHVIEAIPDVRAWQAHRHRVEAPRDDPAPELDRALVGADPPHQRGRRLAPHGGGVPRVAAACWRGSSALRAALRAASSPSRRRSAKRPSCSTATSTTCRCGCCGVGAARLNV